MARVSEDEDYLAPLFVAGGVSSTGNYQIYTTYHAASDPRHPKPEEILRIYGVDSSAGYTRHGFVLGATLGAEQLAAIRRDRRVEYVELDCVVPVALYFRQLNPSRIDGEYVVMCAEGTDMRALIARLDLPVNPDRVWDGFSSFPAALSDEQRDRLRHEPDVVAIENDVWASVN